MRTLPLFLVTLNFFSITVNADSNTKVYTWTDNNGIIHYSDRPVQGEDSVEFYQEVNNNVATFAPKESQWQQDYQKDKKDRAKEQKLLGKDSEEKELFCQQLKKRIALFQRGGRLYKTEDNGERNFYSDGAITKELKVLNKQLKKKCR